MLTGFYLTFSDEIDLAANRELHAVASRLLEHPLIGVTDLIPGYRNLYIEYDDAKLQESKLLSWLEQHQEAPTKEQDFLLTPHASPLTIHKQTIEIPVHYDGEDLAAVAQRTGLSRAEVIARHSAPHYHVYALGFTPGFPFLGEVDESLRLPRRPSPRKHVPAHSVAIANAQTGIYPSASPGGWHLLGRALVSIYDPHRERPFLVEPGDAVQFVPRSGEVPAEATALELLPTFPKYPFLKVLEPGLLDLVLDGGRFMMGRYGLARSGPLDRSSARLANRLLRNPPDAPLIEMSLGGAKFEALGPGVVAFAGGGMTPVLNGEDVEPFCSFALSRGDVLGFKSTKQGARAYLAVAGGIESDTFQGSASVDLKGNIGCPLQAGDMLGVLQRHMPRAGFSFIPYRLSQDLITLRIVPGPQANQEALRVLCEAPFTIRSADRMGVRLEGAAVPGGEVISEAVPLGAVQITSGGDPIILLNDRGTLGGYNKPAVLYPPDVARAAQLRPGAKVRFKML